MRRFFFSLRLLLQSRYGWAALLLALLATCLMIACTLRALYELTLIF